ncbi:MAG: sphingosine kinase [Microbacteriaceae bacterium]|nr:sphingosine kinase [Microbacteriaceae bacterium]
MGKLGIVINPTSGRGRGKRDGEQAKLEFAKQGVELVDLSGSDFQSASQNASRAVQDNSIDGLIVVGGDGMFHLAVNATAKTDIPVGLIASGTGNDSARALGLPIHDVVAGVKHLVSKFDKTRQVDLIHSVSDSKEFHSFGAVSAGFDALVNKRANSWNWIKGPVKYRFAMYRELAAFKPIPYRAVVDGVERLFEANLCTVSNCPSYGGGLLITPEASVDDGAFDLFILNSISRMELIKLFPTVYEGKHVTHPAVEIIRAKQVILDSPGMPAYSDGEHVGHSPVSCTIASKALRVYA